MKESFEIIQKTPSPEKRQGLLPEQIQILNEFKNKIASMPPEMIYKILTKIAENGVMSVPEERERKFDGEQNSEKLKENIENALFNGLSELP